MRQTGHGSTRYTMETYTGMQGFKGLVLHYVVFPVSDNTL